MRQGMMLLCCAALMACGSSSSQETWHATMNSAQEVPTPNVTGFNPAGTALFTNNGDGTISYTVNASGLSTGTTASNFTGMHIHLAAPGIAAPVVVPLTTPAPTTSGATSVTGTFSATNVNTGNTLDSVLAAMRNGGAYINIHTNLNKTGELRGQIQTGGL
jgi:hypothetical protein